MFLDKICCQLKKILIIQFELKFRKKKFMSPIAIKITISQRLLDILKYIYWLQLQI